MPIFSPDETTILVENTRHKGASGSLFLTNKRLIFEHFSGIISRKAYITLDLSLEAVQSVAVEGLAIKHLTVYAKRGFVGVFQLLWIFRLVNQIGGAKKF